MSTPIGDPEIQVGAPQPALNMALDAHANVRNLSFSFDKERKELPVVFIQEPASKAPIPIPHPRHHASRSSAGHRAAAATRITLLRDTAKLDPLVAAMRGLAYAAQHSDAVFGTGSLDVARYGRVLKSRQLVGRARCRRGLRRPALRRVGHVEPEAWRVHTVLLARPQRAALDDWEGAGMTDLLEAPVGQRFYGKYRGTVVNNIDPMQLGRIQAIVPDVSGISPTSWAMPCLPGAGINTGFFTVPQIGSGVWIEFEQGDPTGPSGSAATGARRQSCRCWPGRCCPGSTASRSRRRSRTASS